jgi:NADPH:quinone reductase-like Zn-dependent oxidoreductase
MDAMMKAVTANRHGPPDILRLVEMRRPVPKADELLVRIRAATVSAADMRLRSGVFPRGFALPARIALGWAGPRRPILGTDLSGEVEAVGKDVSEFAEGDQVIAFVGARFGCHAEYRVVAASAALCLKPVSLGWEQAAALPFGGTTALHYLRDKAKAREGETILIIGASGAVGSAAVQIARHMGLSVTAVTSTPNVALMASLGCDDVIDYRSVDWRRLDRKWDIIFDTTGTVGLPESQASLAKGGRLALVAANLPQMIGGIFARGVKVLTGPAPERAEDLRTLAKLAAEGVFSPVISATFPLSEAARAHAIADSGRKVGNVVLTVG